MSAESYTRNQVESALAEDGYVVLQENENLVIYHTNTYPGNDLVLDWSEGENDWESLQGQLEFHGIDSASIHNRLC